MKKLLSILIFSIFNNFSSDISTSNKKFESLREDLTFTIDATLSFLKKEEMDPSSEENLIEFVRSKKPECNSDQFAQAFIKMEYFKFLQSTADSCRRILRFNVDKFEPAYQEERRLKENFRYQKYLSLNDEVKSTLMDSAMYLLAYCKRFLQI